MLKSEMTSGVARVVIVEERYSCCAVLLLWWENLGDASLANPPSEYGLAEGLGAECLKLLTYLLCSPLRRSVLLPLVALWSGFGGPFDGEVLG